MAKLSSLLPLLLLLAAVTSTLADDYRLHECLRTCQYQPSPDACEQSCRDTYRQSDEEGQGRGSSGNPYFFGRDRFRTAVQTKEGSLRVLEKFPSDLLRGLENYRVAVYEANPRALILPNHRDAESVMFVAEGNAVITLLSHENKQSYILRKGDIQIVPAGSTFYIINTDRNNKLRIAELVETVSVPGRFKEFFAIGGRHQESFNLKFSREFLEAAFDVPYEQLERLFRIEDEVVKTVPEKEFQEIVRQASSSTGRRHPFEGESRGPFNIFNKPPTFSNQHGKLHNVNAKDYQELRRGDISVSYEILNGGSMTVPNYNSRATAVAVVLDGEGRLEIICPHVSESGKEEEKRSETYRRLTANLGPFDAITVPAGHPFIISAEPGRSLHVVCFQINAEHNRKILLSGRGNILSSMNNAEKQLLFKKSAADVERVLRAQSEQGIVQGPKGRREGGSSEGRAVE